MQNKRGQELSVTTLILIVLGIIILVLLILGFSLGWQELWEKINIFGGGTSLESVVQKCNFAVTTSSTVSYCQTFLQVKIDGKRRYVNCEYSKIKDSLGGSVLSCDNGEKIAADKCKELLKEKFKGEKDDKFIENCQKSEFLVNDKECKNYCNELGT